MREDEAPRDLGALIDAQIRTTGPMSIATYMALCLTHPTQGYYKKADPLGRGGDFVTAPEISQMFGELIGFAIVNLWQQLGEPKRFTLLELGPGRGTLMADMLRVACRAPGFRDALTLKLFETNPALAALQGKALEPFEPGWIDAFEGLGDAPLLVVANEFFDALPIRQFVRGPEGWHERLVGLNGEERVFGLSWAAIPPSSFPPGVAEAAPGEVYEIGLAGAEVMNRLSSIVAANAGGMIVIDYGHARTQVGETLQGVRDHAYADPLSRPGDTDLSAHVDFEALGIVASRAGLTVPGLLDQREFLARLGIADRARQLATANPGASTDVFTALERLTGEAAMGRLFKVFAATSAGITAPGF